ncbi:MAG TPA: signal peptidase I [Verrucomicrobiae bacterium]|nr:signal peptidase I [Verrucomicrobiae bacterium]
MGAGTALAPIDRKKLPEQNFASDPARAIIQKLRAGKAACVCVTGGSMWPAIRSGDIVFVKSAATTQVSVGQVAVFEREGRVFVHRIVARSDAAGRKANGSYLLTKGDTLRGTDLPVSSHEFLGRVVRLHRGRRHIDMESLFHRATGRVAAFLSPVSRIVYESLHRLRSIFYNR